MSNPKFRIGQTVYWKSADVMRAEVVEVIPQTLRKTKYRLRWIDENHHETVYSEDKLTDWSYYWTNDGNPRLWFSEHAARAYRGQR